MLNQNVCRLAILLGTALFSTAALADNGTCKLTPAEASGTWGFASEGVATQSSTFAPQGAVVQAGTVTHQVTGQSGQTLSGNWNVTLTQNDSAGVHSNVQFGGTFQASTVTCQGDFYVSSLKQPAFHIVFVNGGDELRTIALIPNLFLSFPTARKL
ncbi:MAG: hypothetical protein ACRYF2_11515 [Janthinobacterium lividum]